MSFSKRVAGESDLIQQVEHWIWSEEADRELKSRVAAALDEIKAFIEKHRSDLALRKNKLIQTSGFKDETRTMEAALATIQQLLKEGKNVSRIIGAIDSFLDSYKGDGRF